MLEGRHPVPPSVWLFCQHPSGVRWEPTAVVEGQPGHLLLALASTRRAEAPHRPLPLALCPPRSATTHRPPAGRHLATDMASSEQSPSFYPLTRCSTRMTPTLYPARSLSGSPTPFPIAIDGDFFFIDRPSHFVGGMEETIGRTYWLASNKLYTARQVRDGN